MNENLKNNILVSENIRQKGLTLLEYFDAYDKYMHRNIPELLVFFVWYFSILRCYFSDDHSYMYQWSLTIKVLANNFGLPQIRLGILVLVTTPGKFCNFTSLLNLEWAFPVLKLIEHCYLDMYISLSWQIVI